MSGSRTPSLTSVDSDDEFVEREVFPGTPGANPKTMLKHSTESIITWVEEYLTASKYGRLAYQAGDRQLATDRFNLALDIELQAELDSMGDFGVTGNRLRQELQARSNGRQRLQTKSTQRYSVVLGKLKRAYERAAEGASRGNNATDPIHFLHMGAALCCVNEWEKARKTYQDGIACCGECKELTHALDQLDAIENLLMPEEQRRKRRETEKKHRISQSPSTTPSKTSSVKKPKRPSSMAIVEDSSGPVRSNSFHDIKEYSVSFLPYRRKSNPNISKTSKMAARSPLTTKRSFVQQAGVKSPATSPVVSRKIRWNPFRKSSKLSELSASWSEDNLSDEFDSGPSVMNPEWEDWKALFDPAFFSLEDDLDSRTIEYMRVLSTLSDTDSGDESREEDGNEKGEDTNKGYSLSYDGESTDSEVL